MVIIVKLKQAGSEQAGSQAGSKARRQVDGQACRKTE